MAEQKTPSLHVTGKNIAPHTLGEVAWAVMQEYCDKASVEALMQPTTGDEQLVKAAFGSIIESMIILGATKLNYGLIDMLGITERIKFSIMKQVDAQQTRQLYARAKASLLAEQQTKEAALVADTP